MSGQYTRQRYDRQAYKEELQRSTEPLAYRLDPNFSINCNKCFAPYDHVGAYGRGGAEPIGEDNLVDIDSILKGYATIHSKSNEQQQPPSLVKFSPYLSAQNRPKPQSSIHSLYDLPPSPAV